MLVVSVAVLYFAREVLIPLAFALTLALLLNPVVAWLQKFRINRAVASLLALLFCIGASTGVGWVIAGQLLAVADELPNYQQNIHSKVEAMRLSGKGALGRAAEGVASVTKELSTPPQPAGVEGPLRRNSKAGPIAPVPVEIAIGARNNLESALDVAKPFLGPLGMAFMVIIFTAFMLIKREDLRNRALRLAGRSQLNLMTEALDDGTRRVSTYLLLQLAVNAAMGLCLGLGLWLIGVPYAALWGSIAAILRIVPYIGILVTAALPLTLSLAVFDGWEKPLLVIALFALMELLTGNVIEPLLYGAHTGISSLALLVSAVFWTILWGGPGLVLSTPLTVCVLVMGRYVPQLSFLHVLLGDEPVLAAEARFYQRLLAMDIQEAKSVAEGFLTDRTQAEFYDLLIVPTLIMAEQDRHKGSLDPEREEFLFLGLGEIVVESSVAIDPQGPPFQPSARRVFCLPANDAADEIAATMLSRLLERSGFTVISLPVCASVPEMLEFAKLESTDILCISSVLPFAFARARELCMQIRARFPEIKIVAGIWGFGGDTADALRRFDRGAPNAVAGTLMQALAEVEMLSGRDVSSADSPAPAIAEAAIGLSERAG
ncbi:MAG TPA: AI-2E family transporter [Bryobacteraceae bacterium]|jgi:predicted PurR-regulated permease PerM|nr:AI-2E family transporter [Bryobacteraceae bacterium]